MSMSDKKMERSRTVMDKLRGRRAEPESRRLVIGADKPNDTKDLPIAYRFKSNSISTGKYNPATFFPKGLYEQFRRVANLYFLSVAIISLFDTVSPIQPYTTWTPLTLVIGVSLCKEAIEDYKRHVQDREQNTSAAERFNGTTFEKCDWRGLEVGNVVRVVRDEFFPCDIVMLDSSNDEHTCYVETKNLDGETNLKTKRSVEVDGVTFDREGLSKLCSGQSYIECEHPNNSLYTYSGNLGIGAPLVKKSKKVSLNPSNVLLRGSSLRNTEWVIGIAIYTGHDSKVMMNATATPSKRSHLEKQMDGVVITMLIALFVMSTASAIYCSQWISNSSHNHWYLEVDLQDITFNPDNKVMVGVVSFFTSYVLYGYLIPISLYVSLEIVKVFQGFVFLNKDRAMYHAETDTPALARTTNLNEELGMVHTVLSDKTGTLTCNSMEFFKCSIGGVSYGEGVTEIERAILQRAGKPAPPKTAGAIEPSFNFRDKRIENGAWGKRSDADLCLGFFRVLAICQSVIPEGNPVPDEIVYQAESPDELAFVVAAKRFGFFFKKRTASTVTIEEEAFINGRPGKKDVVYDVLNMLEFSSARKRMSVVVKSKDDGRILLFTKGADNVIYERLSANGNDFENSTQEHMDEWAKCGLRTLCLARREVGTDEYEHWNKKFVKASQAIENREDKLAKVYELIERDLTLLGATAIEDKLQVGVPRTIEQLMKANIAVWVLTGDKQDTAINIGQACSLITPQMKLRVINVEELVKKENNGEIDSATFRTLAMASVKQQIEAGLVDAQAAEQLDAEVGMVIDGRSLTLALDKELAGSFLSLGTKCSAVICCRVSPLQKALVTSLVKDSGRITLAIGDGANDVGMIQAAHIGVGISGAEGMQAVMASDFAFAQFRFLERLILLHGRYNYKRIARMVTYFFFKNIAFGLTIFIYNLLTNASGQTVYNDWLMSSFNIFFTNFPVLALGILDQDVRPKSALEVPALYKETQSNTQFTSRRRLAWFAYGIYVAIITFFGVFYGVHRGEADTKEGQPFGLWEIGTTLYSAILFALNIQLGLMCNFWTWFHHVVIWGSLLLWFLLNIALSETEVYYSTYSYKTFLPITSQHLKFWAGFWPVALMSILPYIAGVTIRRFIAPSLAEAVQDRDARRKKARDHQSESEDSDAQPKVEVEFSSPRRMGTLHGVVVESLGIAPVRAEEIKAPKHRRKLSFADVWGPEQQFDAPSSSRPKEGGHSRNNSESLSMPQPPTEHEPLEAVSEH